MNSTIASETQHTPTLTSKRAMRIMVQAQKGADPGGQRSQCPSVGVGVRVIVDRSKARKAEERSRRGT